MKKIVIFLILIVLTSCKYESSVFRVVYFNGDIDTLHVKNTKGNAYMVGGDLWIIQKGKSNGTFASGVRHFTEL